MISRIASSDFMIYISDRDLQCFAPNNTYTLFVPSITVIYELCRYWSFILYIHYNLYYFFQQRMLHHLNKFFIIFCPFEEVKYLLHIFFCAVSGHFSVKGVIQFPVLLWIREGLLVLFQNAGY